MEETIQENADKEVELSGLSRAKESIRIAYSIDPDAFAARFEPIAERITSSLDQYASANDVSDNFSKFSDEITESIKQASKGQTIEERVTNVNRLRDRQGLLNELGDDSGLSKEEISALNQTFDKLITEIKPRAFASRVQEGGKTAAIEIASGIESEFKSTVSSVQGAIEGFGDEFPPLRIALEKTNQLVNMLVGGIFNQTKEFIKRRLERRKEAKLFRIETESKGKPSVKRPEPKKETAKKTKPAKPTAVPTDKPEKVSIDRKSVKALGKELEDNNTGGGGNAIQNALIFAGVTKMLRGRDKTQKKDKPSLLMRLLPIIMIGVTLIGTLISTVVGIASSMLGQLLLVGTLLSGKIFNALKGIGSALAGFGKKVFDLGKGLVKKGVGVVKGTLTKGKDLVKKGATATKNFAVNTGEKIGRSVTNFFSKTKEIFKSGKEKVQKVVGKNAKKLSKPLVKGAAKVAALVAGGVVSAPVDAAVAIGGGIYLLYQGAKAAIKEPGSVTDKLKAGGKAVASEVTLGASNLLFDDKKDTEVAPKTFNTEGTIEEPVTATRTTSRQEMLEAAKATDGDISLNTANIMVQNGTISAAVSEANQRIDKRTAEVQTVNRVRQTPQGETSGPGSASSQTSVMNNTNNNTAVINRTSPENPETTYRQKSAEGFTN